MIMMMTTTMTMMMLMVIVVVVVRGPYCDRPCCDVIGRRFIGHVRKLWLNPLERRCSSATSNYMKFVHLPLMGGLLHLVQRSDCYAGTGRGRSSPVARPGPLSLYEM